MTESFEHHASKYYDPVKVHEYYMKTRSDYSKTLDSEINKLYSDASMTKAVQTKKKV